MKEGRKSAVSSLPRTVLVLGAVSFFNDLSSEMIYPLLPVFLSTVLGAGALSLGIIEGAAESASSLLKLGFGLLADRLGNRKPLILSGYLLSGAVRPLIGLASAWPFVLAMRLADRAGKGVRTSPRDALLAESADPLHLGRAFGFQRAMDHAGGMAGPLAAAALLSLAGLEMRTVFLLAAVPAVVTVALILWGVREPKSEPPAKEEKTAAAPVSGGTPPLGRNFSIFVGAVFLFALANSTDAFILWRLSEAGWGASGIAFLWAVHHAVKSGAAFAGGRMADRLGKKPMVIGGWVLYAVAYACMGLTSDRWTLAALFLAYGLYYGMAEPSEKAWVADLAPPRARGAAYGWYNLALGVGALPASIVFGAVYAGLGPATAFLIASGLALAAACLLPLVRTAGR
ncbi:MAG: MFS transporter [Pseudomonadota bacterium]